MTKQSPTTAPVTSSVIQPPSLNFSTAVITRIVAHSAKPTTNSAALRIQRGAVLRSAMLLRAMPNIDSENVRNTLMLYMTTSLPTSPPV